MGLRHVPCMCFHLLLRDLALMDLVGDIVPKVVLIALHL
jgi:hypothetical protein